jgi:hypothetical protein
VFVGKSVTSDGAKFIVMVRSGSVVSLCEVGGWPATSWCTHMFAGAVLLGVPT